MSPKTFEMAIPHERQTTRTELRVSVAGFIFIYVQKYFSGPLGGIASYGSATAGT